MARILIVYQSATGHTAQMAQLVAEGAEETGAEVVVKGVEDTAAEELKAYDGIIVGSPTYYGLMSAPLKKLFDESVAFHHELTGKVGGAFTSAGNIGGGNETTILSILQAMLIHGMVVQGTSGRNHYGAASVGSPDDTAVETCRKLGERVAKLVKKLHG